MACTPKAKAKTSQLCREKTAHSPSSFRSLSSRFAATMTTSKRGSVSKESIGKRADKDSTKTKKETSKKAAAPLAAVAAKATTTAAAGTGAPSAVSRRGRSSAASASAAAAPPVAAALPPRKKTPVAPTKIAPATRTLGGGGVGKKSTSRVAAVSQTSSDGGSGSGGEEEDEEESDEESDFAPELGSDSTPSGSDDSEIEGAWRDDGGGGGEEGKPEAAGGEPAVAAAAFDNGEELENQNNNNNDNSDSDSSDGGRPQRNTAGDVPLEWYRAEDHVGYDVDGRRLGRRPRKDALDALLERADGGAALRTIYDERNDEDIVLSHDEIRMVTNIRRGAFPHVGLSAEAGGGINPFEDEDDYYTRHRLVTPINAAPEPKRRFMPSKWEERAVVKLVRALRKGWIKPRDKDARLRDPEAEMFGGPPRDFLMWGDDGSLVGSDLPGSAGIAPLPAPKVPLPGHGASYNPPAEYLAIEEERERAAAAQGAKEEEEAADADGPEEGEKKKTFFDSLRAVPAYADFVRERFERCLDLYLCPRAKKRTPHVDDAATLLPDLPSPQDLRPFPRRLAARLRDASGPAPSTSSSPPPPLRGVALDPRGQWVAAAGDAGVVAFWDARTGRLAGRVDLAARGARKKASGSGGGVGGGSEPLPARVDGLSWRPGPAGSRAPLLAAAVGDCIVLLAPPEAVCTPAQREGAEEALRSGLEAATRARKEGGGASSASEATPVGTWSRYHASSASFSSCSSIAIDLGFRVKHLAWHGAGDYLVASTAAPGGARTVSVHRLSAGASQAPFRKLRGGAPGPVAFHPTRPALLLACGAHVRVYDLAAQALEKKLVGSGGGGGAAALAIHPRGEHVLVGGGDGRLAWYDLDLSPRPFRALRYHSRGVRAAAFHPTHPLLASAGDDGAAHVLHGAVYNDLVTPPLIVPLKVLPAHSVVRSDGCLGLAWHPTQPWLYTVGGDGCLCIWVDN